MGILKLIKTSPVYQRISEGYESSFDSAMMAALQPGMHVFDVGANVGYYSEKFAKSVTAGGIVHAFEPIPASAAKVFELESQYPWLHLHQCAVADQPGEAVMAVSEVSTSPNHMIAIQQNADPTKSIVVPVITLDSLAGKLGVPNFIKIDVEG
jgi:FkbM family methyltransferase